MESKKMVQMNLSEKQRDTDVREQKHGFQDGKGAGMGWETGTDMHTMDTMCELDN